MSSSLEALLKLRSTTGILGLTPITSLEALKRTDELSFRSKFLTSLPESIGQLTNLTRLGLYNNKLSSLPESIGQLTKLTELHLGNNQLSSLPESIGQLANLTWLNLSNNQLSSLPESIGQLTNLTGLYVENNPITELPESITRLKKLATLLVINDKGEIQVQRAPIGITALPCWNSESRGWGEKSITIGESLKKLKLYSNHINENITDISSLIRKWKACDRINISNNKISTLPDQLSTLTVLCDFNIANNMFTKFPDVLLKMGWLTSLNIAGNSFTELPEGITKLAKLANLEIKDSNGKIAVQRAPVNISFLPCYNANADLQKMDFWLSSSHENENLTDVSALVEKWKLCERINIAKNQISSLPVELSTLTGLRDLNLSSNKFTKFPDVLLKITCLASLNISHNQISSLPEGISSLANLATFDFSNNQISSLPISLGLIASLRKGIIFENNPLVNPPKNVQRQGAEAVFNYLRAARLGGMRLWTQARILLLGEGEVGKTTLRDSLMQLHQRRKQMWLWYSIFGPLAWFESTVVERKRTDGVEVEKKVYIPPHGVNTEIQASIWDFGGQDIFHATHVFFLSYGALTMVLYNVVKGPKQSRLGQWLEMVEHTSPDARILVVGTRLDEIPEEHRHERYRECNREIDKIKETFKKLTFCGHIQISNASGKGLPDLEELIYEQLNELPNVAKEVPQSYIKLKEFLEEKRKSGHHIKIGDIYAHCKSELKMNKSESESALQFCVDLGVAVWRKQEESVNKTVFVDPEFLIASFRKVFNIGNSKK